MGFVHLRANLHNVGDWGRSGATKPGREEPVDDEGVRGVGATTAGADFERGIGVAGCVIGTRGVSVGATASPCGSVAWGPV